MSSIIETRRLSITNRVITKSDIQKLANLLFSIFENFDEGHNKQVEFIVYCDDDSTFASRNSTIFEDDSTLNSKRVMSISMKFYEFSLDYSIHIELRHDPHNDYDNRIIIKGDDFNWVNGTIKKFEEIIDGFSPQNTFVKRNRKILQTIFSLSIGIIYLVVILIPIRLFNGIVGFSTDTDIELSAVGQVLIDFFVKFPIVLYFVKYFLICLLGYFPAKDLIKYLENLWPKVELQFGPEHKLMEKRQRSTVMNVLLIGVVPIILQLIYDVMENILK